MEEKAKKILVRQLEILAEESESLHGTNNINGAARIERLCAVTAKIAEIAAAMKMAGDW